MVVNCEHVWREISNYLENEVDSATRAAMEAHFKECKHCTAVLDGTRNVVQLYGDDRLFELPAGFSQRLQRRLGIPRALTGPVARGDVETIRRHAALLGKADPELARLHRELDPGFRPHMVGLPPVRRRPPPQGRVPPPRDRRRRRPGLA